MEYGNDLKPKLLPMKLYHGSNNNFETPDPNISYRGQYGSGFYTSTHPKEAKGYGNNLYEYELKGGNFFNPTTYQFNDEQKKTLVEMYKQVAPNITEKEIKRFLDDLENPYKRVYSDTVLNKFRYLLNSNDIRPMFEKLGIKDVKGLEVPLSNYDWLNDEKTKINRTNYIVFDPKTLKMVRKTKLEE